MAVSRVEIDRRIERFRKTLARVGMKVTHQRVEIFRATAASDEHPDAEAIYQRVRRRVTGVSRDTVYRTLATLESQGLVRRTEAMGGSARFDANTGSHHHFVCTLCAAVMDFRSETLDNLPIPVAARVLGRVESAQVQVRGVCAACLGAARRRR